MYNPFKTYQKWLIRFAFLILMVGVVGLWSYHAAQPKPALAAPVLQEAEPQHCCSSPPTATPTPTATFTPTPTPTRVLPACQVTGIIFSKDRYNVGEPINLTVRLADAQGTPLGGAQVVASVERTGASSQAATGFGLIDRVGEYDGVYNQTDTPGDYRFKVNVSDPTGANFRPCFAEAVVQVVRPCVAPTSVTVNGPGTGQIGASLTFNAVVNPSNASNLNFTWSPAPASGQGTATAVYTFTSEGNQTVSVTATNSCGSGTASRTVTIERPNTNVPITGVVINNCPANPVQVNTPITLNASPAPANASQPINYTWSPAPNSGQNTTAATFTFTAPGTRTVTVTAANSGGSATTSPCTITVNDPQPAGPTILIDPATRTISAGGQATQTVVVRNMNGLTAVRIEVAYNPATTQVVDADSGKTGVQVKPLGPFAGTGAVVARNEVDAAAGRIFFDAVLLAPNRINGNESLFEVNWRAIASGTGQLRLENVLLLGPDGQTQINATVQNGTVQVGSAGAAVAGTIKLQGRNNFSGVLVSNDTGAKIETDAAGAFSIVAGNSLKAEFPGYLSAQADLQAQAHSSAEAEAASVGAITLLAGDVNGDNLINILDLAYIAKNYRTDDTLSDLNGDGTVNILDLALLAGNYAKTGPLTNWQ